MSFFGKLKDRLFKSSSKLDAGLEAIVEEGGQTEPTEAASKAVAPKLEAPQDQAASSGVLSRLIGRSKDTAEVRRVLDDEMLESLEELLISADMGVDTALRVAANMAEGRFGRRLSAREIKELMASEIARIMEPFYQVDGSVTRDHGGVGLGLAFARRVTEAMGGGIEISSPPAGEVAERQLPGTLVELRVNRHPDRPEARAQ